MSLTTTTTDILYPDAFEKLSIADGWVLVWITPPDSTEIKELYIDKADDEWADCMGVEKIITRRVSADTARAHVKRMAAKGAHPHTIAWRLLTEFEKDQAK